MCRSLLVSTETDLESFSSFLARPGVRQAFACFGSALCRAEAIFWYVFFAKPGGAGIDGPSARPEGPWLQLGSFSAGLRQGRRGLLNIVDNLLGASGLESQHARSRHFPANSGIR